MDFEKDNIYKISVIQEIEQIIITTGELRQDFNIYDNYFQNLDQRTTDILSNKLIYKENPIDQITTIKTALSKIRNSTISFKRFIENTKIQSLNDSVKNDLGHHLNEIATTLNIIKEKQIRINADTLNAIQNIDVFITRFENKIQVSKEFSDKIGIICTYNNEMVLSLNYVYEILSSTHETIERYQSNINEKNNLNYIDRFKEDTSLIVKKYENEIKDITEKFENQFKNFKLDQEKVIKSSNLLINGVDSGLKNLAELNKRTQNIELEFSKIIGTETEKVKEELNGSRTTLMKVIDDVKVEAYTKLNTVNIEANAKLNSINTAHTDFINLVEKAGIYELTQNYKNKADEEKKDYVTNRRWTVGAICLAILTTVIVIALPIWEHWSANPPVEANYYTVFARLSVSIMFFVLALYTSKQAAKHYECYQENHRTFLQLAALEPFISRMSDEEKLNIRKTLVPIYFNQNADGKFAAKENEVDLPMNLHAIVNRAFDIVSEKKEAKNQESSTENK